MSERKRQGSVTRIISVGVAIFLTTLFGPVGATLVDSLWRLYYDRYRMSWFSSGSTYIRAMSLPLFHRSARFWNLGSTSYNNKLVALVREF
jgi:hypothetical protein